MTHKVLLSIDGGGIRGIIPLCALIALERQLGKPAREVFSFMSGTSTGAIISGALAAGIPAEQVLGLYRTLSNRIFRKDWIGFITTLGSYQYQTKPLADLLRAYYGDVALNDLPVDVLITATRVRDGRAFYFVRDNVGNAQTTGKVLLADCVAASAAAPTYFQSWEIPGFGACVDGGVGIAGNPAYQMCVEAFDYTAGAYAPSETTVVALGTGYYAADSTPSNLLKWVKWLIDELLRDPMEQQSELVQRHYAPLGTKLIRLNPPLPRDIPLDDIGAIEDLAKIGQTLAGELDWKTLLNETDTATRTIPTPRLPRNQP